MSARRVLCYRCRAYEEFGCDRMGRTAIVEYRGCVCAQPEEPVEPLERRQCACGMELLNKRRTRCQSCRQTSRGDYDRQRRGAA